MSYLFLLLINTFSLCVVIGEDGYFSTFCMTTKSFKEGVCVSSDCGSYRNETLYIPAPAFNARWFIEERLKQESRLFKKYPELGNHTIWSYLEKTNEFPDLKEKFIEKQKNQIIGYKRMIHANKNCANPLGSLPPEIQFTVFQYAFPKMFSNAITLNDYKLARLSLKDKERIVLYKRMIQNQGENGNFIGLLPQETQLIIFQYAYPKIFSKDITLNDYRIAQDKDRKKELNFKIE